MPASYTLRFHDHLWHLLSRAPVRRRLPAAPLEGTAGAWLEPQAEQCRRFILLSYMAAYTVATSYINSLINAAVFGFFCAHKSTVLACCRRRSTHVPASRSSSATECLWSVERALLDAAGTHSTMLEGLPTYSRP